MDNWSKEIPIEEGFYWFIGSKWKKDKEKKLTILEIWKRKPKVKSTFILYKGELLSRKEINGYWLRIDKPHLPEEIVNE